MNAEVITAEWQIFVPWHSHFGNIRYNIQYNILVVIVYNIVKLKKCLYT